MTASDHAERLTAVKGCSAGDKSDSFFASIDDIPVRTG